MMVLAFALLGLVLPPPAVVQERPAPSPASLRASMTWTTSVRIDGVVVQTLPPRSATVNLLPGPIGTVEFRDAEGVLATTTATESE